MFWGALFEAALCITLGAITLGKRSLWYDESFSAAVASGGLREVTYTFTTRDPNMIVYHALLAGWRQLGTDEATLRSLSLLASGVAVIATVAVGYRLFGARAGLVAGLVLALSPFVLTYAQEARSYALTMLLVTASSYLFIRAVERPTYWWWCAYAVVAAVACYSHLYAGFVILAHAASLPFHPARPPMRNLAAAAAVLGLALVPLVLAVAVRGSSQISWLRRPTPSGAASALDQVAGGTVRLATLGILCAGSVYVAWRTWKQDHQSAKTWRYAFVLSWLAIPYIASLGISLVATPIFFGRYLIVIAPALALTAAAFVARMRTPWVMAVIAVTVLGSVLPILDLYRSSPKEDWRALHAYVRDVAEPGDGIVFCFAGARPAFEYYALRDRPRKLPQPMSPVADWSSGVHLKAARADAVRTWQATDRRIWVVRLGEDARAGTACNPSTWSGTRTRSKAPAFRGVDLELWSTTPTGSSARQ